MAIFTFFILSLMGMQVHLGIKLIRKNCHIKTKLVILCIIDGPFLSNWPVWDQIKQKFNLMTWQEK